MEQDCKQLLSRQRTKLSAGLQGLQKQQCSVPNDGHAIEPLLAQQVTELPLLLQISLTLARNSNRSKDIPNLSFSLYQVKAE